MKVTQKEKKKPKFRLSFIFLFIFASFAVCFVFYMRDDFEVTDEMLEERAESVVYIEPVGAENTLINPVPKGETHGTDYYDDAVFIGSTTLSGLSDYGFVPSENMLLSDSIRLSNFSTLVLSENGQESGIAETVQRKGAKKVYIMVGLYDLQDMDSNTLFDGLETFVNSTDAQVYLMSLLPVTASGEGLTAPNTQIDGYNSLLLEFADRAKVHYLDVNTEFKGNDGKLPASAAELNGIRLTEAYYVKLSDYILSHAAE